MLADFADIISAWLFGATLQVRVEDNIWLDCPPAYTVRGIQLEEGETYRLKPEREGIDVATYVHAMANREIH